MRLGPPSDIGRDLGKRSSETHWRNHWGKQPVAARAGSEYADLAAQCQGVRKHVYTFDSRVLEGSFSKRLIFSPELTAMATLTGNDAAVATLNANAQGTNSYTGHCSYYVAVAVNAGLALGGPRLVTQDTRKLGPSNGGAMGPKLVDVGYQQVLSVGYQPRSGDVAVVPGYIGDVRCGGSPCGHVAMYNGTQWVSDTNQGSKANPYGNRPLSGEVKYYRKGS
jgi:hypothetical protein